VTTVYTYLGVGFKYSVVFMPLATIPLFALHLLKVGAYVLLSVFWVVLTGYWGTQKIQVSRTNFVYDSLLRLYFNLSVFHVVACQSADFASSTTTGWPYRGAYILL
jgi:hypothetical protein